MLAYTIITSIHAAYLLTTSFFKIHKRQSKETTCLCLCFDNNVLHTPLFVTLAFSLFLSSLLFTSPPCSLFLCSLFPAESSWTEAQTLRIRSWLNLPLALEWLHIPAVKPTLVNVRAEGLRAGQEAQLSWVKCAWLYRLHPLVLDGVCGPFLWCH